MFTVTNKETFLKLISLTKKSSLKERASYCTPLFQKAMKEESEKLTYFHEFEKIISSGGTIGELQKEVVKAHKDASKHRDKLKNSGLTCLPPFILSKLNMILAKDIEVLILIKAKGQGHDLLKLKEVYYA